MNQGLDLFLVTRKAEEQVDFITPLQRSLVNGALGGLGLGCVILEFFAGDAVPTLLTPFDHIALGFNPGKELIDDLLVTRIGGADEGVVADLPALPKLPVGATDGIAMLLGADRRRLSGALNLLTVLITAGHERHLLTAEAMEARQGIAGQGGVGTAQVGLVVDVVERGGEGVGHQPRWERGVGPERANPPTVERPCAGAGSYPA